MRHFNTGFFSGPFRKLIGRKGKEWWGASVALILLAASPWATAQTTLWANGTNETAVPSTTYTNNTGYTWLATNGGSIDAASASNVVVGNTTGATTAAVRATGPATIDLGTGIVVSSNGPGVEASGTGASISGKSVNITNSSSSNSAVYVWDNGVIELDGGVIESQYHNGAWSRVISGTSAQLKIKNATLTTKGSNTHAIRVGEMTSTGTATGEFEDVVLNQSGTGTSSSALFSQFGSTVTAKNVTATVATGRGINANEAGKIELSGMIDVTAQGPNAYGMRANQNASYAGTEDKTTRISSDAASVVKIQTSGDNGYGVYATGINTAVPKATYDLQGSLEVTTTGASAHGIYLAGYAMLTSTKLKSVSAPGASASGVNVTSGSATLTGTGNTGEGKVTSGSVAFLVSTGLNSTPATLTGSKLTAASTGAEAARVEYDSEMTLTDTDLTGATHGVVLKGNSTRPNASFSLTGGSITAQNGDVIRIDAGVPASIFTIELKDDVVVPPTGGNLLNVTAPGTVNFHADIAGTAIGDIVASSNDTVNAQLSGTGWLIDAMHQSSPAKINLTIDTGSHWQMNDSSELNNVKNSGTIDLIEPVAPHTFDILAVNDFEGVGASNRLVLNTRLGDDGSPTDVLHIKGTVSGTTYVQIRPETGSLGAETTGNGILIVRADDSSAISASNFVLTGSVFHNGYAYTLDFNVDGNVYLVSKLGGGPNSGIPIPASGPLTLLLLTGALLGIAWRQRRT